ncbi:Acylaminoacyl-peptidase-related isoform 1 [Hibiscus syriacus]|uniref:Acylaminoacyl-peptidase-related isoform 1 n=1 Tax=Hibiscus syriacus TaxID=106335 RepID=A0A6A3CWG3_HIBSY|nr:Acylaminoacyl-peptidase-related isoform 1 [Hibiscus syriacus]
MKKKEMEPDEVTMGIVVQLYKKVGEFRKAEEFFKKWSFNGSLRYDGGETSSAVGSDSHLSSYTNNSLIETYGKAGQKMEELKCLPDTRTYNILISLHVKYDDIKMAADYFAKMKEARLESDPRNRGYGSGGFTLQGMSPDGYSANIDAFGERGHVSEVKNIFLCCQERKRLTVIEFNVMIKAYRIAKSYDKACWLFDSMQSHGVVPDKCGYSSLIQILATVDLPHVAKCYLKEMQEAGLVSDCISYCAVISGLVKLGELGIAEGQYNVMIQSNVELDVVVYGVLINAFAFVGSVKEATKNGRFEEATHIARRMRELGLVTDSLSYNNVLGLYAMDGRLREVVSIFKEMVSACVQPDDSTFKSLGSILVKCGVPKLSVNKL